MISFPIAGPQHNITFDVYSDSNSIGLDHSENQDSLYASGTSLVFAVADGVGGYLGGKEASQIAVDIIRDKSLVLNSEEALSSCCMEIHEAVLDQASKLGYDGMGTTLALAKIIPEKKEILTANVGDSPIFLVSKNDIVSVYKDDSMRFEDPTNMWSIVQYLGFDSREDPKIHTMTTNYDEENILLLCSDGVSDNILGTSNNLTKLRNVINETRNVRELVREAMRIGLKADDMSAILIFF